MKLKFAILAAAAVTMISGTAQAQIVPYGFGPDIYGGYSADVAPLVQPARVVCDAWGRCFRVRPRYYGPTYVAPAYVQPFGFYQRRHYHRYGYGRRW